MMNAEGGDNKRRTLAPGIALEVFLRFHDLVQIRRAIPDQRDDVFFHYTTSAAFTRIVEEEQLWASDIRRSNDSSEMEHAFDMLVEALDKPGTSYIHGSMETTKMVTGAISSSRDPRFAASLSGAIDDLSQWRAYGRPHGGVSIGLSINEILRTNDNMVYAAKCLYKEEEQIRIMEQLIQPVLRKYQLDPNDPSPNAWGKFMDALTELEEDLQIVCEQVAPVFKNPAFDSEVEWRLIVEGMDEVDRPRRFKTRYRSTVDGIVAYVRIHMPRSAIRQVYVGPSPNQAANERTTRDYLASHGCDAQVIASAVPNKSW